MVHICVITLYVQFLTVYCPPAYLTYMQNTSCERPDWRNPKSELRLAEEISTYADDTTLMAVSEEELKNLLIRLREESSKWYEAQHQKN